MARKKRKASKGYSAHYISGTHWDREWYRPFQEYRVLLVELIDDLLTRMESTPEFHTFHLDGQTCVLADYVEARPENRDRLAALMREGRILVGPWFTMPDLFCPGDEGLIRNLLTGRRVARDWGVEPMPVAYTCDMFGHPSQMPQIYRGFDLRHCVLGRGANEHTTPAFFRWEAPDGSTVFCFKLQDGMGYGAFVGSRMILEAPGAAGDADAESRAGESLRAYCEGEIARSNGPVLCLMDALDHMMPALDVPRYLAVLRKACPNVSASHSNLPAFFAEAESRARRVPTRRGELREPGKVRAGYLWLIANCVSSRVRMKQANDAAQTLLERWAEPWMALANAEGAALPERFLQIAWDHVVLCHAHDSICGCSIDQVHRDMMYRFDQARILAAQLRHRAFAWLTKDCADLASQENEFTVTVANPVARPRREVLVFDIDLPTDYPASFREGFRSQDLKAFTLTDVRGRPVRYQRLGFVPFTRERTRVAVPARSSDGPVTRYTVAAELDLPGLGFTSLLVKPGDTPVRAMGSLRTGPVSAENEHLAIRVAENGTLALTDRATDETYRDLLLFEDRSEIGDGWFHGESVNDAIALSSGANAGVSVVHDGPEIVTFRIEVTLDVPARYDWHAESPVPERVPLRIASLVSLRRGARVVDVETTVENVAEDHRLRLLLPTDATGAKTWLAHHPFDIVERPIALARETETWQEADLAEKPFLGFQAVGAGARGLAFLSAGGLHEGGVADDARRTMQVTLLRSFRRTAPTEGESDGLERGTVTHRYALMPFAGKLPRADTLAALAALQAGVITRQTGPRSAGYPPMVGKRRPHRSFIEQKKGSLVLSAVKPRESGGGIVLRLWNPEGRRRSETLAFRRPVKRAERLKLSEDPAKGPAPTVSGRTVSFTAGPHAIVTLGIELR